MSATSGRGERVIGYQDPSEGPREGKTYGAMLERRVRAAAAESAGTPWPSNLDAIEVESTRRRTRTHEDPPTLTAKGAVAVLTGHIEGVRRGDPEALALEKAVNEESKRREVDEIARRGRIGRASHIFTVLSDDDQRVLLRLLEELPYERLRTRCQAITDEGREPATLPDGSLPANPMRPTPHEHVALATLLGAYRDLRLLVLGPRSGR